LNQPLARQLEGLLMEPSAFVRLVRGM
jgi:hypothetical protein